MSYLVVVLFRVLSESSNSEQLLTPSPEFIPKLKNPALVRPDTGDSVAEQSTASEPRALEFRV